MNLKSILKQKGSDVYTIAPDATVAGAVQALVQHNCGSLIVRDANGTEAMAGIITERDILKITAVKTTTLDQILVSEVMTSEVITAAPDDSVESVMGLMTKNRIRHLPVIANDLLVGMISIGDVVKAQFDALAMENHYLKTYIQS